MSPLGLYPTGRTSERNLLVEWRATDLSPNALTGQPGTCTRASTGTVIDANGAVCSVANNVPLFGYSSGAFGLRLERAQGARAADAFSFACNITPRLMTGLVKWVELANSSTWNGERVIAIGDTSVTLNLRRQANGLYLDHNNGATIVTASRGALVSAGDTVTARFLLAPDGSVALGVVINGAAESISPYSAPNALAVAWGGSARLYLNSLSSLGLTTGFGSYQSVRLAGNVQTMAQLSGDTTASAAPSVIRVQESGVARLMENTTTRTTEGT
jgi:hypothetical protein